MRWDEMSGEGGWSIRVSLRPFFLFFIKKKTSSSFSIRSFLLHFLGVFWRRFVTRPFCRTLISRFFLRNNRVSTAYIYIVYSVRIRDLFDFETQMTDVVAATSSHFPFPFPLKVTFNHAPCVRVCVCVCVGEALLQVHTYLTNLSNPKLHTGYP